MSKTKAAPIPTGISKEHATISNNILQSLTQIGDALGSLHASLERSEFDAKQWPNIERVDQLIVAAHNTLDVAAGLMAIDRVANTEV